MIKARYVGYNSEDAFNPDNDPAKFVFGRVYSIATKVGYFDGNQYPKLFVYDKRSGRKASYFGLEDFLKNWKILYIGHDKEGTQNNGRRCRR